MSEYITKSQLTLFKGSKPDYQIITENRNRSRFSQSKTTIFLSHSHKDKDLIEAAVAFFMSQGVFIYVDWMDHDMPQATSGDTAMKIKRKIEECDYFVVLASMNALNSKWVPWELGYADKAKGVDRIGITTKVGVLPVANDDGKWKGAEYLQIYPQIQLDHNWIPGRKNGIILKSESRVITNNLSQEWLAKRN